MGEIVAFKYRAFLSYSHRDAAWGKWLHRRWKDTGSTRIWRAAPHRRASAKDTESDLSGSGGFSAGHSLAEQTIAALEGSQFLVVICSPNSA